MAKEEYINATPNFSFVLPSLPTSTKEDESWHRPSCIQMTPAARLPRIKQSLPPESLCACKRLELFPPLRSTHLHSAPLFRFRCKRWAPYGTGSRRASCLWCSSRCAPETTQGKSVRPLESIIGACPLLETDPIACIKLLPSCLARLSL